MADIYTPMDLALNAARAAAARGEVPVGAVVTGPDGAVLAIAGNQVEAGCDAAAHAELLALRSDRRGSPAAIFGRRWSPARCARPPPDCSAYAGSCSAPTIQKVAVS